MARYILLKDLLMVCFLFWYGLIECLRFDVVLNELHSADRLEKKEELEGM